MFSGFLQDWTTMDGAGTAAFVQSRADWLDLAMYGDVVFWIDVRGVTNPGAGNVVLTYETSPTLDDALFQPLGTVTLAASSTPVITKVQLSQNPAVPLGRFVRWKLAGTASGNWSVTFRIFAMANHGTAGGGFDPATLALTSWWRANFAGVPWSGTASAGPSATPTLVTAGSDPTAGATQNGYTPASFDGVSQKLACTTAATSLFTVGAGTIVVLAKFTSPPAPAASPFDDPGVFSLGGAGEIIMGFNSTGLRCAIYDGAYKDTGSITASAGAYHLLQMTWNSTNLIGAVDAGTPTSLAAGAIDTLTGFNERVGTNYNAAAYPNMLALEIMTAASALSASDLGNIKSYVNARYGLSL